MESDPIAPSQNAREPTLFGALLCVPCGSNAVAQEKRGYTYSESNPDLLVNFSGLLARKTGHDSLDKQAVGYYGYRQGERVPVYKTWSTYTYDKGTKEYVEGTVNIELIDAKARQLVWEGIAIGEVRAKTLKAEDPSPQIAKAIGHVFEKYPFKAK